MNLIGKLLARKSLRLDRQAKFLLICREHRIFWKNMKAVRNKEEGRYLFVFLLVHCYCWGVTPSHYDLCCLAKSYLWSCHWGWVHIAFHSSISLPQSADFFRNIMFITLLSFCICSACFMRASCMYLKHENISLELDRLLHGYDRRLRPGYGGKIFYLITALFSTRYFS